MAYNDLSPRLQQAEFDQAVFYLEVVKKLYTRKQSGEGMARLISEFDVEWAQIQKAQSCLTASFHGLTDRANLLTEYQEHGELFFALRFSHLQYMEWLKIVVEAVRTLPYSAVRLGFVFSTLSSEYYAIGDFPNAVRYLDEAERIAVNTQNQRLMNTVKQAQAMLALFRGDAVQARQHLNRLQPSVNDSLPEQIALLSASGQAAMVAEDYKTALAQFQQALALARQEGDSPDLAGTLNNLVCLYNDMKQFNKAIACGEEGIDLAQRMQDRDHLDALRFNVAASFFGKRDYKRALHMTQALLETNRADGNLLGVAQTLQNIGNCHMMMKQNKQARQCFSEARDLYRSMGMPQAIKSIEGLLRQV